jgi:hypothetical protein
MMWLFGATFVVALAVTTIAQGLKNWAVDAVLLGRFILIWLVVMVFSVPLVLAWFFIEHHDMLGAIN